MSGVCFPFITSVAASPTHVDIIYFSTTTYVNPDVNIRNPQSDATTGSGEWVFRFNMSTGTFRVMSGGDGSSCLLRGSVGDEGMVVGATVNSWNPPLATSACLSGPTSVVVTVSEKGLDVITFVDSLNYRVRRISTYAYDFTTTDSVNNDRVYVPSDSWIDTLAGTPGAAAFKANLFSSYGYQDFGNDDYFQGYSEFFGYDSTLLLTNPSLATSISTSLISGLAVDTAAGTMWLSDTNNHIVRSYLVPSQYPVTGLTYGYQPTTFIVAGTGGYPFTGDRTAPYVGGDSGDFGPPEQSLLNAPAGLALDSFGNIFVSDAASARVRGIVRAARVNCPKGYQCPCVSPVPCTNRSFFCPGRLSLNYSVQPGYVPVSISAELAYDGVQACKAGSFCSGGLRILCPPGTFGLYPRSESNASCRACPLNTFSVAQGASVDACGSRGCCTPCPPRSTAPLGSKVCTWDPVTASSCPSGNFSFSGAFSGCVPRGNGNVTFDGPTVIVEFPPFDNVYILGANSIDLQNKVAIPCVGGRSTALPARTALTPPPPPPHRPPRRRIGLILGLPLVILFFILALRSCCGVACLREGSKEYPYVVMPFFTFLRLGDQVRGPRGF